MTKLSYLASTSETRRVLDQFGLMTKKALGQHFLINDGVVRRICDLADVNDQDDVLEVGPGIGTLSVALLSCVRELVAIERDPDLVDVLAQTCAQWQDKFTLISADALDVASDDLPLQPHKLVSNLPYAVAATVVLHYFEQFPSIQSQTIMVQAEVADRMCAQPGSKNYGAYTVKLGLFAHTAGRFSVSESNFFPPPRVKSAVIRLDRHSSQLCLEDSLRDAVILMADAAFATRRKTIVNSMKAYFSNPQTACKDIIPYLGDVLEVAGISPKTRGETLEQQQFIALGSAYLAWCDSH